MASLINNLGGVLGFGENYVVRNDDSYTSGVDLTSVFGASGLNFFGSQYNYVSINNNGNITLSDSAYGGLSTYTPFGLASGGYAIIAPFFADVDTRLTDGIADANQVTPTPGGTSRGSDLVWYDLDTTGYGTLTVTWDDVGYYSSNTDKLNAFQLQVIGQGGGNFDIVFRYESINWTTGDASSGTGGLGGTIARAGYSTGDGTSWYELPQSGYQDSMLALESALGNTGVAGLYRFSVRTGTELGETITGTSRDDLLAGAGGNDTIYGKAGNDSLIGNAGADTLVGGLGNDTYATDGLDSIVEAVGAGIDTVNSAVSFTLGANLENLRLSGDGAINGTGNGLANVLSGNGGDNVLNGLGGIDTVDYSATRSSINIDLGSSVAQYVYAQGYDTLLNIENVIGSIYGDTLRGTAGANVLNGNLGNDSMYGGAGNDTYFVDSEYDYVYEVAGEGNDGVNSYLNAYTLGSEVENGRIMSSGVADLTGNAKNNVLYAGIGSNVIAGGDGVDTLSYQFGAAGRGVTVSLAQGAAQATGGSGSDTVSGFERLIGSAFADRLSGNAGNNLINGGDGADRLAGAGGSDTLQGGKGADILIGGVGKDYLTGGAGNDVFLFGALADSLPNSAAWDVVTDFVRGQDKIDLRGIDANTEVAGNDVFTGFIGSGEAFSAAGQLRLSSGILYGNVDSDAAAEFAIKLSGVATLETTDILL